MAASVVWSAYVLLWPCWLPRGLVGEFRNQSLHRHILDEAKRVDRFDGHEGPVQRRPAPMVLLGEQGERLTKRLASLNGAGPPIHPFPDRPAVGRSIDPVRSEHISGHCLH